MKHLLERIELYRDYSTALVFDNDEFARYLRQQFTDDDWEQEYYYAKFLFTAVVYYRFELTGHQDDIRDFIIQMLASHQGSQVKLKASVIEGCIDSVLFAQQPELLKGVSAETRYETQYLIVSSVMDERDDMSENYDHFLDFADEQFVGWEAHDRAMNGTNRETLD